MEPFSIQTANAAGWVRSVGSAAGELAAVLRVGRIVAGDVLQTLAGGTVLVGVGRHRVPARAQTELQPGQRYLFEVIAAGEPCELRVVSLAPPGEESNLVRALRSVLAAEQPLGAMLELLEAQLKRDAPRAKSDGAALARLLEALTKHVFTPGESGASLAAKLRSGGLQYESRLTEFALQQLAPQDAERLQTELRAWFVAEWSGGTGGAPASPGAVWPGSALEQALRQLLAESAPHLNLPAALERWSAGRAPGLPRELGALLELAAARAGFGRVGEAWSACLRRFEFERWPRGLRDALLRGLASISPAGAKAAAPSLALAALATDLKAELLRALDGLAGGPTREAIERTLKNLEAEQLLNVARGPAHEPTQWSVAVLEGARRTTAHLFVHHDDDGQAHAEASALRGAHRFSLAVEFTHTGPVHVDLLVRDELLAVRVVAARDDVVAHLRSQLPELEQHLAQGGRPVQATAARAPEEELRVADAVENVRFLRQHHLMDLSG